MDLILWRHAEAEDTEPDLARNLTDNGRRQAQRMAQWLRGYLPDRVRIVCSPANRTRQTVDALGLPYDVRNEIAPGASADALLKATGWPRGDGVVMLVGKVQGNAEMPLHVWLVAPLVILLCTLTFAALGVFIGYVVPGENAMQILGPGLALLSFLGGVFIPIDQYAPIVRDIAYWTPMYGVAEIARYPLTHDLPWYAVVNAVGWFLVFIAGAAWRMSKDTSRV